MLGNIRLLITACQALKIDYKILHETQNIVRIDLKKSYFFVNYATPFLCQSTAKMLKDKDYTYQILKNQVKMPKTQSFLSPFCEKKYVEYLEIKDIDRIVEEINSNFSLPTIVKRNSGSSGKNVFLCKSEHEVKESIEEIFNIDSKEYDYIALAQEYIDIAKEYRGIFFDRQLKLLYEKDNSCAKFVGNLSPLHWEGAIAKHITDSQIIAEIESFIQPIFKELDIVYGGFDVARDRQGMYWLIEINSHPNYDVFTRDNDPKFVIDVFKTMLQSLREL